MRVELVRIGNSRGIRIPKPIIEQCGFGDSVDLRVEDDRLVIAPAHSPRQGWKAAFAESAADDRDPLLLESVPPNEFDEEEWAW
jgi:antitoxin MazE